MYTHCVQGEIFPVSLQPRYARRVASENVHALLIRCDMTVKLDAENDSIIPTPGSFAIYFFSLLIDSRNSFPKTQTEFPSRAFGMFFYYESPSPVYAGNARRERERALWKLSDAESSEHAEIFFFPRAARKKRLKRNENDSICRRLRCAIAPDSTR